MPRQPLIFHHLIKTGGSSINAWIEKHLPPDERLTAGDESEAGVSILFQRLETLDLSRIRVVYGHGAHHAVPYFPTAKHLVLTRDPVSYAVSRYVFDRKVNAERDAANGADMPLHGDAVLDRVLEEMLAWGRGPSYNTCTKHMLRQARAINPDLPEIIVDAGQIPALLDAFDYVGVTDRLDLFWFLIVRDLHLPARPVERVNSTGSGRLYLPLWFREQIEALSPLDLALYREAHRRMDALAARHFNTDANAYRLYELQRLNHT